MPNVAGVPVIDDISTGMARPQIQVTEERQP